MATELAKAYVQIVPSAKGLKENLSSVMKGNSAGAGEAAGESIGSSLVGKLKGVIAAAGIGMAVKTALDAGGALQQSFGGLDTLYGDASEAAKKYAQEAAQAGISMNDYAEQAVSFGASLKSAFEGDTTKAVEAANTAILDMADNAAKMGTPLESIQNAYQGFAKQNYTMLDNLKLGYGGTKQEMQRLLEDATKLSGVEYNMDNLGDVYSAIHVIQEDLGLTGVAAEEASETFTGSFGAMKAAATNVLAMLTTGGDVNSALQTLMQSASTFLFNNLMPMVLNIVKAVPGMIKTGIQTIVPMLPGIATDMMDSIKTVFESIMESSGDIIGLGQNLYEGITKFLSETGPQIMQEGSKIVVNLANGVLSGLPELINKWTTLQTGLLNTILQNLPQYVSTGMELVKNLASGLANNLPAIISAVMNLCKQIILTILKNLPQILQTATKLAMELATGLLKAIPVIIKAVGQIWSEIKGFWSGIDWKQLGLDCINGIINGVKGGVGALVDAVKAAAQAALDAACKKLGINSPSKVFRDKVGSAIPEGIAVGIAQNEDLINSAIKDACDTAQRTYDANTISFNAKANSNSSNQANKTDLETIGDAMVYALEKAGLTVQIGNREFGRIVREVVNYG